MLYKLIYRDLPFIPAFVRCEGVFYTLDDELGNILVFVKFRIRMIHIDLVPFSAVEHFEVAITRLIQHEVPVIRVEIVQENLFFDAVHKLDYQSFAS